MAARLVPMQTRVSELVVPSLDGSARSAGLFGSAFVRDRRRTATLTNPSLDLPVTARVRGARVREAKGVVLAHPICARELLLDYERGESRSRRSPKGTVPQKSVAALDLLMRWCERRLRRAEFCHLPRQEMKLPYAGSFRRPSISHARGLW